MQRWTDPEVGEARVYEMPMYLSKFDMVTGALRARITAGDFAPGDQLRQRELAESLNVSITPVREALRRLESEGLVTYDPHAGATVVKVDFGPTKENFLIRAALESLAGSLAAEKVTDADLAELEGMLEAMDAVALDDLVGLAEMNRNFHFRIYEMADAALLDSLIRRLWQSFGGGPKVIVDRAESMAQHRFIVAALRTRSPKAVEAAIRDHIISGMRRAGIDPPSGNSGPTANQERPAIADAVPTVQESPVGST